MRSIVRALMLASAIVPASAGLAHAATPPGDLVGQGSQFWAYAPANDSGTGPLVVQIDTRSQTPGTALVTYSFSSGAQSFFWNSGQQIVTGSWATGWEGTTTGAGGSDLEIGPFGDGTNIAFDLNGFASFDGRFGEGPWTSDGSFSVTAGQ
jgi:hypothetical protein